MSSIALYEKIDALLSELDRAEPISFNLGVPELPELDAVHQLVTMGNAILPRLLKCLQGNMSKKRIAYVVMVLKHLDDARALVPLINLRAQYQNREVKDEWDYAVIGQCNLAIFLLQKSQHDK